LEFAADQEDSMRVIQIACKFAFNMMARSTHHSQFSQFLSLLRSSIVSNVPACRWLLHMLADDISLCTDLSLNCRENSVRSGFTALVSAALLTVAPFEESFLFGDEEPAAAVEAHEQADQQAATAAAAQSTPSGDASDSPPALVSAEEINPAGEGGSDDRVVNREDDDDDDDDDDYNDDLRPMAHDLDNDLEEIEDDLNGLNIAHDITADLEDDAYGGYHALDDSGNADELARRLQAAAERAYEQVAESAAIRKHASTQQQQQQQQQGSKAKSACRRLLQSWLGMLDSAAKQWMRFGEFFEVLHVFAKEGGHRARGLLNSLGAIHQLLDFYLGEESPMHFKGRKVTSMGNRLVAPLFGPVLSTAALIIRSSTTGNWEAALNQGICQPDEIPPFSLLEETRTLADGEQVVIRRHPWPIGQTDLDTICTPALYKNALFKNEAAAVQAVVDIAAHWAWHGAQYSQVYLTLMIQGVKEANNEAARPYIEALRPVLMLNDEFQSTRIEYVLRPNAGLLYVIWTYRSSSYVRFVYVSIKALFELVDQVPELFDAMKEHRADWLWMDSWMYRFSPKEDTVATAAAVAAGSAPPPLVRQGSRTDTFDKYLAVLTRMGFELDLNAPAASEPSNSAASAGANSEGAAGSSRPAGSIASNSYGSDNLTGGNKRSLDDNDGGIRCGYVHMSVYMFVDSSFCIFAVPPFSVLCCEWTPNLRWNGRELRYLVR
jgi:hypothetical protein